MPRKRHAQASAAGDSSFSPAAHKPARRSPSLRQTRVSLRLGPQAPTRRPGMWLAPCRGIPGSPHDFPHLERSPQWKQRPRPNRMVTAAL